MSATKTENTKNHGLYTALGLKPSYFFDKETWGSDKLVVGGYDYEEGVGRVFSAKYLAQTPLSPEAQKDMLRLFDPKQPDYMPGLSSAEKKLRLAKMSYNDYLLNVVKVDKQVIWFFQNVPCGVFAVGTDATPALFGWEMGLPGFLGLKLDPTPEGVLADLTRRATRAPERVGHGGSLSRWQRHHRPPPGSLADSGSRPGQDHG